MTLKSSPFQLPLQQGYDPIIIAADCARQGYCLHTTGLPDSVQTLLCINYGHMLILYRTLPGTYTFSLLPVVVKRQLLLELPIIKAYLTFCHSGEQ